MRRFLHKVIFLIYISLMTVSCTTAQPTNDIIQLDEEGVTALKKVGEALTGEPITDAKMKEMQKQLKDKEAQSAVQTITDSLKNQQPSIKYCPSTGNRYAGHLKEAPDCDVPLEWLNP